MKQSIFAIAAASVLAVEINGLKCQFVDTIPGVEVKCRNTTETGRPEGQFQLERCWYEYVPESVSETTGAGILVNLHGFSACATLFAIPQDYSQWRQIADAEGLKLIMPQGPDTMPDPPLNRLAFLNVAVEVYNEPSWNAGGGCCGGAFIDQTNDSQFLRQLIQEVAAEPDSDPSRVYVVGHSNGCAMANRVGLEHSDIVTAVGCHSFYDLVGTTPGGYNPVPVIKVQGTEDNTVPFDPALIQGFIQSPGALESLERWKTRNNCNGEVKTAPVESDQYNITEYLYDDCAQGADVALLSLEGAGHLPFGGNPSTTQRVYDFIKRYSRNQTTGVLEKQVEVVAPTTSPEVPEVAPTTSPSMSSGVIFDASLTRVLAVLAVGVFFF